MVVERAPCLRRVVVDLVVGNVLETTPSSLDFEEALGKSRFSLWNNFRKKKKRNVRAKMCEYAKV